MDLSTPLYHTAVASYPMTVFDLNLGTQKSLVDLVLDLFQPMIASA